MATTLKIVRFAVAAVCGAVGAVLLAWSGWLYSVAARGGDEDYTATGWAVFATVGLALALVFLYLAWLLLRQVRGSHPSSRSVNQV